MLVNEFAMSINTKIRRKNFEPNCAPLSVSTGSGAQYLNIQMSANFLATVWVYIFLSGITCVHFQKKSVMTSRDLLVLLHLGSFPKITAQMETRGPRGEPIHKIGPFSQV